MLACKRHPAGSALRNRPMLTAQETQCNACHTSSSEPDQNQARTARRAPQSQAGAAHPS